jgi:hypothetical protein
VVPGGRAVMGSVVIAYQIEQTDSGWLVWRILPGREPETVGWLGGRGAHPSRRDAASAIGGAQRADRAAATPLGVELEHR